MTSTSVLVICASWEDRFVLGLEQDIHHHKPSVVLQVYSQEFADWTRENRGVAEAKCKALGVQFIACEVTSKDSADSWRAIEKGIRDCSIGPSTIVLLDFSTMPREWIWMALFFIKGYTQRLEYIYFKPLSYSPQWLTMDPQFPKLVLKHSGIMRLGTPTAVVVLPGYDLERTFQFHSVFEPSIMLLGFQDDNEFPHSRESMEAHLERVRRSDVHVDTFQIDAYSDDHGQAAIEQAVAKITRPVNLVVASLGPKPTAIALYRIWLTNPSIALCYASSGQYNRNYSIGLGKSVRGKLSFA